MAARSAVYRSALSGQLNSASKFSLGTLSACLAILFLYSARQATLFAHLSNSQSDLLNEEHLDQNLYQAATTALGSRDGTIIVMDPQTGRIRAVVNPKLASETVYAPGSTIKPFTLLVALRAGAIRRDSRILCREHYSHEEFETTCSHPKDLPPFGPREAIAYSCNYYFGKVGEQLNRLTFNSTLAKFGLVERTGVDWLDGERESVGRLPGEQWRSQNAMGEGGEIQVTPIQLLTAYSALVNGGHLFKPHSGHAKDFLPQSRRNLLVDSGERSIIVEGMRGAVRYGTAERASLYSLPAYVFGKTGTATELHGFRTQGWFVGFASWADDNSNQISKEPKSVKLAVLIFLKRARGAEAAQLARPIFQAFARAGEREDAETGGRGDTGTRRHGVGLDGLLSSISVSPRLRVSASEVRVHLVRENITRTMPLEDYVLGVVASEGSIEDEPEALKALAVASRTYALKNERRHVGEGYDFCSTTHCQRYRLVNLAMANTQTSLAILSAVKETTGETLQDSHGQIVDSYFGASCGGTTANIHTLWGARGQDYLKGERDEYCQTEPHHSWVDVISSADLLRALQSDPRTDVGDRLTNIRVVRQDATGRAELIALEGLGRRTVNGWDFKIIVGRALGWNLLKSSRFEVSRSGSNYVFSGSGFGHGLGLCQEGAHVMAQRGAGYREILTKYFPGTRITRDSHRVEGPGRVSPRSVPGPRQTLAGEHFRVSYPTSINQRDAENLLGFLESSRRDLIRRVGRAGISVRFPALEIFVNETTGDFVGRTRQPPWAAAATQGNKIELQPIPLLKRRQILETTLRHELVHVLVDVLGHGRTPRWLSEGLALHVAGEGPMVSGVNTERPISVSDLEHRLSLPMGPEEMRAMYAAAYREVTRLTITEGERAVWQRVLHGKN